MASKGINKVILIGNLGADPETKTTPSGLSITNLRLATSESWKDKQTGEMQDKTEWHRVVIYGKLAEIAAQYLRKGAKVYIEGRLQTRKWQDKESGQDRYATEIVGNEMQMLDGKGSGRDSSAAFDSGSDDASYSQASSGRKSASSLPTIADEFDDDIPF